MNKASIRRATVLDINDLLELEKLCFISDKITKRQFRYLISHGKANVFLSDMGGKVVGYGILLTPSGIKRARVYSLAVRTGYRGYGIGSALIAKMIGTAFALGYEEVSLEVRKQDLRTQRIYESFGFKPSLELKGYYADGADGLRMVRPLPNESFSSGKSVLPAMLGKLFNCKELRNCKK